MKKINKVLLLPNALTALSLMCGCYSILQSYNGNFGKAALLIFFSFVLDGLDGKIARLTGSVSSFGKEFDSLSDLVAFGVAPGVLVYGWVLWNLRIGWGVVFLFIACGALRLARFNVSRDLSHFQGLPIPGAALFLASFYLFSRKVNLPPMEIPLVVMLLLLSFLMVSTIPYPSFKKLELKKYTGYRALVLFLLFLVVLFVEPIFTLFFLSALYVAFGPVKVMRRSLKFKLQPEKR
jgi:CDP-diacylglycerol--serine O-phosphatidyltransferase